MASLALYFVLLFGHFLGEYVFQSRWQSLNKGLNPKALALHCLTYSGIMTAAFIIGGTTVTTVPFLFYSALVFFIAMFSSHFVIDAIATRVYNYLWTEKKFKGFFSVVGFEQLLYQYMLLVVTIWFVGS